MKKRRDSVRKKAVIAGVLYIIGTVAGILSLVFTGPLFAEENYLSVIAQNPTPLLLGILSVLIMALSLAMIPIVLFSILKMFHKTFAIGYVVFRSALECLSFFVAIVSWLFLLLIAQEYTKTSALNLLSLANLFQQLPDQFGNISTIIFLLGALMFYFILYKSKLVPRWLSGWGLISAVPYLVVSLLGFLFLFSSQSTIVVIFAVPLAIQEMVLAVWLIAKGFNKSVVASIKDRV